MPATITLWKKGDSEGALTNLVLVNSTYAFTFDTTAIPDFLIPSRSVLKDRKVKIKGKEFVIVDVDYETADNTIRSLTIYISVTKNPLPAILALAGIVSVVGVISIFFLKEIRALVESPAFRAILLGGLLGGIWFLSKRKGV